jgi:hypothetical protein
VQTNKRQIHKYVQNGNKQEEIRSSVVKKLMGEVKKFALERHITFPY